MYTYIEHLPICVGVCMHVSVYVYVYPQIVGRGSWVAVDIYILVEPRSGCETIVLRLSVCVCVCFCLSMKAQAQDLRF